LVALAVAIAAVALSVACYVHRRSSTTTSSKGQAKPSETFVLALGEGKQAKKVEATLAQDAEMGGYASQLNPMFQTEFSGGGSDSQIFLDDSGNDRARSPVLESGRDRDGAPPQELQPRVVLPGPYEYVEAVLVGGPLEVFEGVSGEGDADTDAADADGEETEGVSIGADDSSGGGEVWGMVTWTKRTLDPLGPEQYASSSSAFAAETAAAEQEPAAGFDVNAYDGPPEYGGAAAQFDGRVDDIDFIHDSDEPEGGAGQNECALDDAYTDEPDDAEAPNESGLGDEYVEDGDGAEEQNEYGFEFEDPYGDDQHDGVLRL
jgi:hypothetical protein